MKIKRLKIIVPASRSTTASHDARAIGEAIAKAAWTNQGEIENVRIAVNGDSSALLGQRISLAVNRGKRNGS